MSKKKKWEYYKTYGDAMHFIWRQHSFGGSSDEDMAKYKKQAFDKFNVADKVDAWKEGKTYEEAKAIYMAQLRDKEIYHEEAAKAYGEAMEKFGIKDE